MWGLRCVGIILGVELVDSLLPPRSPFGQSWLGSAVSIRQFRVIRKLAL